jgi:hypothetical protein
MRREVLITLHSDSAIRIVLTARLTGSRFGVPLVRHDGARRAGNHPGSPGGAWLEWPARAGCCRPVVSDVRLTRRAPLSGSLAKTVTSIRVPGMSRKTSRSDEMSETCPPVLPLPRRGLQPDGPAQPGDHGAEISGARVPEHDRSQRVRDRPLGRATGPGNAPRPRRPRATAAVWSPCSPTMG